MPFNASVFRVMIASPSDLREERQVVAEVLQDWNSQHASAENVILLPVRWETHALPRAGVRPQEAINRELVDVSDFVLGLFWTRFGTNTGVAESGTVEEIDRFVSENKPALLYFSKRPIDPSKIDVKQHKKLKTFQKVTYKKSMTGTFGDLNELRQTLLRDITRLVRSLKFKTSGSPKNDSDSTMIALQRQVEELALRFHRIQSQLSMQAQFAGSTKEGDINAERAVLGAILLDNHVITSSEAAGLEPADFSLYSHEIIFNRMMDLVDFRKPIDFVTLVERLTEMNEVDTVGGVAYVTSLTDGIPRPKDIGRYVARLKSFRD